MCLVEVNEMLAISCALPLTRDMCIMTQTARLRHSREGVLEFLLVNHPLDCPICDQGGECDLQDISFTFGSDRGRFFALKRAVDNLNCLGPLVKTIMTRCIHCTRCVRYFQEYGGSPFLGTLGRGSAMEIGTYVNHFPMEELSANVIDLCPVGALTAMPYAFSYRSWELLSFETIDIFDALASSLRVDVANNRIVRVLPVLEEHCNEEWISNQARFSLDSLSCQRLLYPKVLSQGSYYVIAWSQAIALYLQQLFLTHHDTIQAICGPFLDLSTALVLKNFFHSFGCSNLFSEKVFYRQSDLRAFYFFGATLLSLESSTFFIFVALNLRFEAPLINSRLRKNYLLNRSATAFYSLGLAVDYLTFAVSNLGNSMRSLMSLLEGKLVAYRRFLSFTPLSLAFFNSAALPFLKPFLLLGASLFHRRDCNSLALAFLSLQSRTFFRSFIIAFICDFLGKLSFWDVNCSTRFPKSFSSHSNFILLVGAHGFQPGNRIRNNPRDFIVLQSSHKNLLPCAVNLLLPVKAHGEKALCFFNLTGLWKASKAAVSSFRLAFADVEILSILNLSRRRFLTTNFSFLKNFYFMMAFFLRLLHYQAYFLNSKFHADVQYERHLASQQNSNRIFLEEVSNFHEILPQGFHIKLANSLLSRHGSYGQHIYGKNSKIMALCAKKILFSTFSLHHLSLP